MCHVYACESERVTCASFPSSVLKQMYVKAIRLTKRHGAGSLNLQRGNDGETFIVKCYTGFYLQCKVGQMK